MKLRQPPAPTITELIALQNIGTIGTIEFRTWLAELYPEFKKARRSDVDEAIEALGEELRNESKALAQFNYLGEED